MANLVRPADKKPLESDGRFKLEWDTFFSSLLNAVNAVSQGGLVAPKSVTVATLPNVAENAGRMVYVTNEAGGPTIAYSNGTNWRRVYDNTIVS